MNRRDFLKVLGLVPAYFAVPKSMAGRSEPAAVQISKKPNIIFILIDDMGWADLGCYGNRFHETPNISRLASEGMKFTDAYAACPVCSPTRASIMAGQYPARIGITDFIPGHQRPWEKLRVPANRLFLPLESVTIAEVLKGSGYSTGYIGKWHLGNQKTHQPNQQGFDWVLGAAQNQNDKYVTAFTNAAVEFIEDNKDKPFFLFLSHHTVHIPLEAPAELVRKCDNKAKPPDGVNNPVYAAMVEHLDNSVGRILKRLQDLELENDTIIVFFSDNGGLYQPFGGYRGNREPATTNAPLRDEKGTLYEGGIRVPLIIRWPGVVKAGTTCGVPVTSVDFYPTFMEIAGAGRDAKHVLDGQSILPLMRQTGALPRDAIYWHYAHYHHSRPAGAIRQGDYKLIEFYEDGRLELYNLKEDIGEKENLAKKMPQNAAELQLKLAAWRESVGAKMPTPNPDYDLARADEWGTRR